MILPASIIFLFCQVIAPKFDEFSEKYPDAVFLKVSGYTFLLGNAIILSCKIQYKSFTLDSSLFF
jgi:hypothetical protein